MGTFATSVVVNGKLYLAGEDVPDSVVALITNPALIGGAPAPKKAGEDDAPALGDDGVTSVDEVVAWVDGDPVRAQMALDWEDETRDGDPRVTLVRAMQEILSDVGN